MAKFIYKSGWLLGGGDKDSCGKRSIGDYRRGRVTSTWRHKLSNRKGNNEEGHWNDMDLLGTKSSRGKEAQRGAWL